MFMREGEQVAEREFWLDLTWGAAGLAAIVISFVPGWLFALAGSAVMR